VYLFSNFYSCDICQNTVLQSATLQVEHIKLVSFHLCAEQTLHLPDATPFLFSLGRTWDILHFLNPPCTLSAGSFTSCCLHVGHVRAVDVKLVIHRLRYLFHFFSRQAPSFPEYSQAWRLWKHSLCPFAFGLWCVFFNTKLFRAATCRKKNINFLVHFTVFLQHG